MDRVQKSKLSPGHVMEVSLEGRLCLGCGS